MRSRLRSAAACKEEPRPRDERHTPHALAGLEQAERRQAHPSNPGIGTVRASPVQVEETERSAGVGDGVSLALPPSERVGHAQDGMEQQ